jgi:hypothetical protein
MFPVKEIKAVASILKVEHLEFKGDQLQKIRKLLSFPKLDVARNSHPKHQ